MESFKINNFLLRYSFVLLVFFLFSCRTAPENEQYSGENISLEVPVSVKINFFGVEYENEISQNDLMAENNTWGGG